MSEISCETSSARFAAHEKGCEPGPSVFIGGPDGFPGPGKLMKQPIDFFLGRLNQPQSLILSGSVVVNSATGSYVIRALVITTRSDIFQGVIAVLRYQSRRHRFLMNESEQALSDAAEGGQPRDARIAQQTLSDSRIHRLWESRHADLVLPVAENTRRTGQIFKLRDIEVKLLHRRALIRCIRNLGIVGEERDRLFSVFYGPKDTRDAILTEHRQYSLAVSSRVSTDHLIDVMHDPISVRLLQRYEVIYSKYFELYCATVSCEDQSIVDATRLEMAMLRKQAMLMIKRIHSERPESSHSSFEQQALLARSGRYPIRDYMVG